MMDWAYLFAIALTGIAGIIFAFYTMVLPPSTTMAWPVM